jgi:hypothetical protein
VPTNFADPLIDLAERAEAEGCPSVARAILSLAGSMEPNRREHRSYILPTVASEIAAADAIRRRSRRETAVAR